MALVICWINDDYIVIFVVIKLDKYRIELFNCIMYIPIICFMYL